ncbi:hypothetical protein JTE90_023138 [Oedothorax gibbosus]|uniref:Uncharacterized protein n=1 Tax=Oedothorax gibbosus TaxID=931172 RepID=A0AAV6URE1_9ARAC|nr:hypothetical protein JTE90_023138 [Oedothorax gibbosus]
MFKESLLLEKHLLKETNHSNYFEVEMLANNYLTTTFELVIVLLVRVISPLFDGFGDPCHVKWSTSWGCANLMAQLPFGGLRLEMGLVNVIGLYSRARKVL